MLVVFANDPDAHRRHLASPSARCCRRRAVAGKATQSSSWHGLVSRIARRLRSRPRPERGHTLQVTGAGGFPGARTGEDGHPVHSHCREALDVLNDAFVLQCQGMLDAVRHLATPDEAGLLLVVPQVQSAAAFVCGCFGGQDDPQSLSHPRRRIRLL